MTSPVGASRPPDVDIERARLYVDGCPNCTRRGNMPITMTQLGHEMACTYVCACGARWNTRRLVASVEDGRS